MNKSQMEYTLTLKEMTRENLSQEIKAINAIMLIIDKIKEVTLKFDKKVINKKFFTAIQEICTKEYHCNINFYQYKKQTLNFEIFLHNVSRQRNYYSNEILATCLDEKRLNAENALEEFEREKQALITIKQRFENDLSKLDELAEEYMKIYDMIDQFNKKTTSVFREQLNFKIFR